MAGYRPSSFLCVYLWTEMESKSINKANIGHLDRMNLVDKRFTIWLSRKFFLRDTAGGPKQAR